MKKMLMIVCVVWMRFKYTCMNEFCMEKRKFNRSEKNEKYKIKTVGSGASERTFIKSFSKLIRLKARKMRSESEENILKS